MASFLPPGPAFLLLLGLSGGTPQGDLQGILEDSKDWIVAVFPAARLPGETGEEGEESLREKMWRRRDPWGETSPMGQKYLGTGVVVSPDGEIITSHSVIAPKAESVGIRFCDGRTMKAAVVSRYERGNLALLKIDGEAFKAAPLARKGEGRPGDVVYTVGNALDSIGIDGTPAISRGVIARVGRGERGYRGRVLETDAAINTGSYGGALLDPEGEVKGIVDTGYSDRRWLGQAIPIDVIREILPDLRKGWVPRHSLGMQTVARPDGGVKVSRVLPGGPAEEAGIRPDDILLRGEGKKIDGPRDVDGLAAVLPVGARVEIEGARGREEKVFRVRIGRE